MSSKNWVKHFQQMKEGKIHPDANGLWRLIKSMDISPKRAKVNVVSSTQQAVNRARSRVRGTSRGNKRKASRARSSKPSKRIKGTGSKQSTQSKRKPHKNKKTSGNSKRRQPKAKTAF